MAQINLLLHGCDEIRCFIFFNGEVGVPRHPKGMGCRDVHSGKESFQIRCDDLFAPDKTLNPTTGYPLPVRDSMFVIGNRNKAWKAIRQLDPGEAIPPLAIFHDHRQIEAQIGNMRKRMGRIEGHRGQCRKHFLQEVRPQAIPLGLFQIGIVQNMDAGIVQLWQHILTPAGTVAGQLNGQLLADRQYLIRRRHAVGRHFAASSYDLAAQAGHADHEEFIEVRGEDSEEFDPFQ